MRRERSVADSIDIVVPDLGDFNDVEIIEVLVSAGDRVAREDGRACYSVTTNRVKGISA